MVFFFFFFPQSIYILLMHSVLLTPHSRGGSPPGKYLSCFGSAFRQRSQAPPRMAPQGCGILAAGPGEQARPWAPRSQLARAGSSQIQGFLRVGGRFLFKHPRSVPADVRPTNKCMQMLSIRTSGKRNGPLMLAINILRHFQNTKENVFALFFPFFYLFKFHLACNFVYSFIFLNAINS